ncbi:MAG: ATP-dependent Clp protease ATP-binding subunit [Calditrichaeota bacterium]|nr:MAG: ATP-dependent Clp protease ATP-binding subunit [Calditrichota bacterium]
MENHPVYQFEKYSDNACKAIAEARKWASKNKCQLLSSQYILAGLLETEPKLLQHYFKGQKFPVDEIFEHIDYRKYEQEPSSNNLENVSKISLRILSRAAAEATHSRSSRVETSHILNSLIKEPKSIGSEILEVVARRTAVQQQKTKKQPSQKIYSSNSHKKESVRKKEKKLFNKYCSDLTQAARAGNLPPMIGREKEIQNLLHTLGRKTKNNPILVGDAGVGKTAIVEGLAQKIVAGDVHESFANKTLLSLDLTNIIAGTKYRGEFEERLREIIDAVKIRDDILLFIDEVHTIIGVGASEGALDAANIMKPALARGELYCIGATTPQEFQRHFTQDKALARRFQPITVDEPGDTEVRQIAVGIREHYEVFHQVLISDASIDYAIHLANHYLPERSMPDKVIDLLDEACSRSKLENHAISPQLNRVKTATLQKVISAWTGIPLHDLTANEKQSLLHLETKLNREIFGQEQAIVEIAKVIRRRRTGVTLPQKPVGVFLFIGPTGVGKTALAQALASHVMGSSSSLIRLDMTEFKEAHSVSKIIGAPPGYVGFQQSSYLAEKVRKQPHSIILFDEIEKAHNDVYNLLLQIFDDGHLRDAIGEEINFRHALIIMTSNIKTHGESANMGFGYSKVGGDDKQPIKVPTTVSQIFSAEFINRLDNIIQFQPLSAAVLQKIFNKMIWQLNRELEQKKLSVKISAGVKNKLVGIAQQEKKYGARPLRRLIAEFIEDDLSMHLLSNKFRAGSKISFVLGKNGDIVSRISEEKTAQIS